LYIVFKKDRIANFVMCNVVLQRGRALNMKTDLQLIENRRERNMTGNGVQISIRRTVNQRNYGRRLP